jgi:hypothetical protein
MNAMNSGSRAECYAGDTSDVWEVGFRTSADGVKPIVLADLDGNFSCRIAVKNSTMTPRAVTVKTGDNQRFRAWLTPEETEALGVGEWIVGIEIRNPTLIPALVKEVHRKLWILEQAVPAA